MIHRREPSSAFSSRIPATVQNIRSIRLEEHVDLHAPLQDLLFFRVDLGLPLPSFRLGGLSPSLPV